MFRNQPNYCRLQIATLLAVALITRPIDANSQQSSHLYGSVTTLNGASPVFSGWVITYVQTTAWNGMLNYHASDTALITAGTYEFADLPVYGSPFILKAIADPLQHPELVPTFFTLDGMTHRWGMPSLNYFLWSDNGQSQQRNIEVLMAASASTSPGPCAMDGGVYYDSIAPDPVPGVGVFLEKLPGNLPWAYTETDPLGNFMFSDMSELNGDEAYQVYLQIPGFYMDSSSLFIFNPCEMLVGQTTRNVGSSRMSLVIDTVMLRIYPLPNHPSNVPELSLSSFTITPNPSTGRVMVSRSPDLDANTIRIVDISGREAFSSDILLRTEELDISHLPKGAYIVRLGHMSQRIVLY
jgi:hypothetical protein